VVLVLSSVSGALARPVCHTPAMRQAPAVGVTAAYRPAAAGFVDSELYPLRVHYRREQDAQRVADLVLPAADTSWAIQMDAVGWPVPPPDGMVGGSSAFDIYLTNEGTYGGAYVWGFGPDVISDDNWFSVASYMALDEAISDAEMLSYVAHELNHASQYTIDAWEWSTFIWESTAEVMADLVDDAGDVYIDYGAMVDFQEFPFLSLVFDGYRGPVIAYDPNSYYEYGGIIFGMFVEQFYGVNDGAALLDLWDQLAQPTTSADPDFLDALSGLEPTGSLAALYAEFAVWRMFTGALDDGAHFEEAALWGDTELVGTEAVLDLSQVDGFTATPLDAPYDLGTNYYVIELGTGTDELLQVDVAGDVEAQWGLAWAVWYPEGPALTGTVVRIEGAPVQAQIPLAGGVRAQFGVVNAGPVDMDAEVGIRRRSFEVALALLAPPVTTDPGDPTEPPATTGTTDDPPPAGAGPNTLVDAGCGCAAAHPAAGWWVLLAPVLLRRGRRG
jgi:hypothetical protein